MVDLNFESDAPILIATPKDSLPPYTAVHNLGDVY